MESSQLTQEMLQTVEKATSLQELEDLRIATFGKKGFLTLLLKDLSSQSLEEKRVKGAQLNLEKEHLQQAFELRKAELEDLKIQEKLSQESIDISLPPAPSLQGKIHPLSKVTDQVIQIFSQMGFKVAEGPDIEDDFHNFTALNIPPEHPARQEQDTFYLASQEGQEPYVLRTHTSPVQIREMLKTPPPLRLIALGRTYRSDHDATHTPMFHQVEGLVIDKHTHMGHLKGCLEEFFRFFFEDPSLEIRFRPGYFPFTEPSAEVDVRWKGNKWLEILGCGMVHPKVLKNCQIDPTVYQGFAFGMGIERITMLKYGIEDLRLFFDSDMRWLSHYGFNPEERG